MDKMAVLTMPAIRVETSGPDLQVHRQHRQGIIRGFGLWLRDSPQVTARKGKMTRDDPRSVWMQFQVERDRNWYSLYFPCTSPNVTMLWIRAGERWSPLEMFALKEYGTGQVLAEAVMAFLDSDGMDVVHRWRDGEDTEVARCWKN
jgi:riboflavin biosynthesis pyrimidine reductase